MEFEDFEDLIGCHAGIYLIIYGRMPVHASMLGEFVFMTDNDDGFDGDPRSRNMWTKVDRNYYSVEYNQVSVDEYVDMADFIHYLRKAKAVMSMVADLDNNKL